jgi:cytochrome c oxidase subunit II
VTGIARSRPGVVALVAAAALAVVTAGCLPAAVTAQGQSIADLYRWFVAGGIVVALIVWVTVTLAIIRRRRDDQLPRQLEGNVRIEVIWTAIPLLTVLGLFALTVATLNTVNARNPGSISVQVTGFRWQWQFDYLDANVRVVGQLGQTPEMVVPVREPVHVALTAPAGDVNHAFFVPQFLFKRDAIAGRTSEFDFTVQDPGTYRGQCAEFCGIYHDAMIFSVRAVPRADYDAWIRDRQTASQPPAASAAGPSGSGASAPPEASAQPAPSASGGQP